MEKEEFEDIGEFGEEEEDEQEEEIIELNQEKTEKQEVKKLESKEIEPEEIKPERIVRDIDKFFAYHQIERMGIFDKEGNKVFSEDMWVVLADILNRLERIEKSLG